MLRDGLTPSSLETRMQPGERKEPTTTETKGADILLLRQVQRPASVSSHLDLVFVEE